jgi:hypothetical protein
VGTAQSIAKWRLTLVRSIPGVLIAASPSPVVETRPRIPGAFAIVAAAATALCAWKFFWTRAQVRHLLQERDVEREVADILDEVKQFGAQCCTTLRARRARSIV